MGKRLYQVRPESIPPDAGPLVMSEFEMELEHFKRSGDATHLWRGWLLARSLEGGHASMFQAIAPLIDAYAVANCEGLRADQAEARNWILADYYHELSRIAEKRKGAPKNKRAARILVAKRHNTTPGAVEQMVLKHEGKDGRGTSPTSYFTSAIKLRIIPDGP